MILVFDSGTTNTKTFLFDRKANLLATACHPTLTHYPVPGQVEQEAETWWKSACAATRKLQEVSPWKPGKISAVAVSSQGATFVPLGRDRKPLRSGITWLDNRGEKISRRLIRKYGQGFFYHKTGHFMAGWSPLAILLWLKEKEDRVFSSVSRVSFVADYLNYKLTGRFFLDPTSAQMSFLYNIQENQWDRDLLKLAGMEEKNFPELLPADAIGGKVTKEAASSLGIPAGVPVVSGGHDQYCASLGAGATHEGDCLLSCGTAWALLLCTRKLLFDLRSRWVPGRHLKTGTFGLMAAIGDGGVVLDWVRRNIRLGKGTCEKESRVSLIPYFSRKQGAIRNLSLGTSGRDIYLAALKALAREVKNYLDQVRNKARVKRLLMVGGGTREKLLPTIIEEVTGVEAVMPEVAEAAGRGAALLALQCHSALDAESSCERRTSCHTGQM